MISSFEDFLKQKYDNERTVNGYLKDVEMFLEYCESENIQIVNIKETNIKKFIIKMTEEGYSNHTIARKNSALRLYFKFLRKSGLMIHNPMDDIKQPILNKQKNKTNAEDIEKLEERVKISGNKRDMLMFHLSYREKIKLTDVIKVKVEDYDKKQSILYLQTKALYVNEQTKELLEELLKVSDSGYIFKSKNGKPLTESGAYYIIKNYINELNIENLRPIDLVKEEVK